MTLDYHTEYQIPDSHTNDRIELYTSPQIEDEYQYQYQRLIAIGKMTSEAERNDRRSWTDVNVKKDLFMQSDNSQSSSSKISPSFVIFVLDGQCTDISDDVLPKRQRPHPCFCSAGELIDALECLDGKMKEREAKGKGDLLGKPLFVGVASIVPGRELDSNVAVRMQELLKRFRFKKENWFDQGKIKPFAAILDLSTGECVNHEEKDKAVLSLMWSDVHGRWFAGESSVVPDIAHDLVELTVSPNNGYGRAIWSVYAGTHVKRCIEVDHSNENQWIFFVVPQVSDKYGIKFSSPANATLLHESAEGAIAGQATAIGALFLPNNPLTDSDVKIVRSTVFNEKHFNVDGADVSTIVQRESVRPFVAIRDIENSKTYVSVATSDGDVACVSLLLARDHCQKQKRWKSWKCASHSQATVFPGTTCESCGMSPIVGDRFSCSECFMDLRRKQHNLCGHCKRKNVSKSFCKHESTYLLERSILSLKSHEDNASRCMLALMYELGTGAEKRSPEIALNLLKGHDGSIADYIKAYMLYRNNPSEGKVTEARELFKKAAYAGLPDAQSTYAIMCFTGEGGDVDKKEASKYAAMASKDGDAIGILFYAAMLMDEEKYKEFAQHTDKHLNDVKDGNWYAMIGTSYYNGWGRERDMTEARVYLERAIFKYGYMDYDSILLLIRVYLTDAEGTPKAERLLRETLERTETGSPANSEYRTAMRVILGSIWRNKEKQHEARELFSAEQENNVGAQLYLAIMNMNGEGGPTDLVEARRLCELAATENVADAQYLYGSMLYEGSGGEKDLPKAIDLLRDASLKGHALAQFFLATVLFRKYLLSTWGRSNASPVEVLQLLLFSVAQNQNDALDMLNDFVNSWAMRYLFTISIAKNDVQELFGVVDKIGSNDIPTCESVLFDFAPSNQMREMALVTLVKIICAAFTPGFMGRIEYFFHDVNVPNSISFRSKHDWSRMSEPCAQQQRLLHKTFWTLLDLQVERRKQPFEVAELLGTSSSLSIEGNMDPQGNYFVPSSSKNPWMNLDRINTAIRQEVQLNLHQSNPTVFTTPAVLHLWCEVQDDHPTDIGDALLVLKTDSVDTHPQALYFIFRGL